MVSAIKNRTLADRRPVCGRGQINIRVICIIISYQIYKCTDISVTFRKVQTHGVFYNVLQRCVNKAPPLWVNTSRQKTVYIKPVKRKCAVSATLDTSPAGEIVTGRLFGSPICSCGMGVSTIPLSICQKKSDEAHPEPVLHHCCGAE